MRQEHKVLDLEPVIHRDGALAYKVHLSELFTIVNNIQTRFINSSKHVDNQLIDKASLTILEEMSELPLEIFEYGIHDLSLHLGRDLLIEVELLDDQVEIMQKGIMHILLDVGIEVGRDVVGLVRTLNLFDPDIQHTEFFINETLKII